jgi:hypothetical protein
MGYMDNERQEYLSGLVDGIYKKLVRDIIADIKALPKSCHQSGDDSVLTDVWEEFKYQVQEEESALFEAYEHTIRSICIRRISKLDSVYQGLLWLWSDGYFDWDREDEVYEIPFGDPVEEALEQELYQRVSNIATDEELAVDPEAANLPDLADYDELVDGKKHD